MIMPILVDRGLLELDIHLRHGETQEGVGDREILMVNATASNPFNWSLVEGPSVVVPHSLKSVLFHNYMHHHRVM